jgi:flagellar protein FliO/FliZ
MDSLFGDGTSLPVRFFIAFVVVFALIGVTAWLIRRFGSGALGGTSARGRAPRLAVIEAGAVDGRRKLVLIRRDNIEHLLMIGGPTDIVVEANIVRGQNAREAAPARTAPAAESLPRLPAEEWPLQPEATPRPAAARAAKTDETATWALPPEPAAPTPPVPPAPPAPAKRARAVDPLAGLAAELSVKPAEPAAPVAPAAPAARTAPVVDVPRPKPAAATATAPAADQNLADMASRLEAALRRPGPATPAAPAPAVRPAAAPKPATEAQRPAAPVAPPVAPPIAPPAPPAAQEAVPVSEPATAPIVSIEPETAPAEEKDKTAAKPDDVFGSIEQEMANLLGRPSGKPS